MAINPVDEIERDLPWIQASLHTLSAENKAEGKLSISQPIPLFWIDLDAAADPDKGLNSARRMGSRALVLALDSEGNGDAVAAVDQDDDGKVTQTLEGVLVKELGEAVSKGGGALKDGDVLRILEVSGIQLHAAWVHRKSASQSDQFFLAVPSFNFEPVEDAESLAEKMLNAARRAMQEMATLQASR